MLIRITEELTSNRTDIIQARISNGVGINIISLLLIEMEY